MSKVELPGRLRGVSHLLVWWLGLLGLWLVLIGPVDEVELPEVGQLLEALSTD
ncbi:hypothetical protein [Streptomyces sp. NPDC048057]|uniref:hypothetical protein n=1 Tax=Streptomyces sp. NPDC048057 TaxID=3155628 RepID=UPI0033ED9707